MLAVNTMRLIALIMVVSTMTIQYVPAYKNPDFSKFA